MKTIPSFLYGTAWKEEETGPLTLLALQNGFRGIDTANQRKHYFEAAVGEGVAQAVERGVLTREELFLQSKFTHRGGQDHRLPYDEQASVATQVRQSLASTLEHLGPIDSFVLHGPTRRYGLGPEDLEAWSEMGQLQKEGQVPYLGVSNVSAEQLTRFLELGPKPRFVQNRCFASLGWDAEVRALCRRHGLIYQGFSLLTANRRELSHPRLLELAASKEWTPAQLVFRFALEVGMLPLTGTTDAAHMQQDLAVLEGSLTSQEVDLIERIGQL